MIYNKHTHNLAHLLKALIGNLFSFDFLNEKGQLIVLNYHGTQKKFIDNFTKQINFLKKHYEFVSPTEFKVLLDSKEKIVGRKVLLTFDDGIKNNLYAIDILNKYNIRACFFIVPGFIDSPLKTQKEYFIKNIRPVINSNIDNLNEDFSSLTWEDIKGIAKNHLIGCHTYTHTMVKDSLSYQELETELVESKNRIEIKTGIVTESFCSINNTLLSVGKKEREMIEKNYSYHFTTFAGNNTPGDPCLIKRINVESHWLMGAFKFALSPFELRRWAKKIQAYQNNTK